MLILSLYFLLFIFVSLEVWFLKIYLCFFSLLITPCEESMSIMPPLIPNQYTLPLQYSVVQWPDLQLQLQEITLDRILLLWLVFYWESHKVGPTSRANHPVTKEKQKHLGFHSKCYHLWTFQFRLTLKDQASHHSKMKKKHSINHSISLSKQSSTVSIASLVPVKHSLNFTVSLVRSIFRQTNCKRLTFCFTSGQIWSHF